MKKYKTRQAKVLVDICCDVCGNSCKNELGTARDHIGDMCNQAADFEFATISANWGYCSRKDGESYHLDLCENCFDAVVKYVDTIKTQKRESENNERTNN